MSTWGNLPDDAREKLAGRTAGPTTASDVERRIRTDDRGRVRFRLFGGTDMPGAVEALRGERFALGPPPPQEVTLIDAATFDYEPDIDAVDAERAAPIDASLQTLRDYFSVDPGVDSADAAAAPDDMLPPVVDHRPLQSPVKHQGTRGTCVSHASLGLLEAHLHISDDLSEQHAHFKFNEFQGVPHDEDNGLRTTDAAGFLARPDGRVAFEQDWPYIDNQPAVDAAVGQGGYGPPPAARQNEIHGYRSYKIIGDQGVEGESIKNTRFLESLLAVGLDIVIGTWVSWADEDNRGVLAPLLDPSGAPIGAGGHAMLVVGYDRPNQYFIVKNSWGAGWGHAGYGYFSYDYIRTCFKYGFTVSEVEPPAAAAAAA